MRIGRIVFLLALGGSYIAAGAQAPGNAAAPAVAPAAGGGQTIAATLQPALDGLHQTMQGLKLDKWKGGGVRGEAERNISSIMKDLEATLPPLVTSADAASASVSAALPVERNLDALYAVVLRVYDAARVAAPGEQVDSVQQAMSGLEGARRLFADRLTTTATAQEKQIGDLQTKLKTQAVPACPAPPPAPVCPTPKKTVKRKPKPAASTAAPTTPKPATPPAGTTAKPNQ